MKEARRAIEGHEQIARRIQDFVWEGKPYKSKRIPRNAEEYEALLLEIAEDCWTLYDNGAEDLGWE